MAGDNLLTFQRLPSLLETNDVEHNTVFVVGEDVMVLEARGLVIDLAEKTKNAGELLLPVVIASSRISSGRVDHDIVGVVTKESLQISSHESVGAATEDLFVRVRHRSSLPHLGSLEEFSPCLEGMLALEAGPRAIGTRPTSAGA
jgi:hypothetical protein